MQACFVQNLWLEAYGGKLTAVVRTDSSAGKAIASRRGPGKLRHLQLKQLFVQDLVTRKRVYLEKEKGDSNVADLGTKSLARERMEMLMRSMWIGPLEEILQRLRQQQTSR